MKGNKRSIILVSTAKGVKFVISGINWTMCRPGVDDYSLSIEKLVDSMREKGIFIFSNRAYLY